MQSEIRHITPDDFPSIIDDLADMQDIKPQDRDAALRVLDWWFFRNPWGAGVYAGAFQGSRLAGVASLTPKQFMLHGKPVRGAELGRIMTHADFRGQGISPQIVEHLREVARSSQYEFIYGTPNAASARMCVNKLDFHEVLHSDRFGRPLNWRRLGSRAGLLGEWGAGAIGACFDLVRPMNVGNYEAAAVTDVQPDLEAFLDRACKPFDCYLQRTADYVRWRLDHPLFNYVQVYLRSPAGELRGWAAVRLTERTGEMRAHIGDFWSDPDDSGAARSLLGAVAHEARELGMDEVYAIHRPMRRKNVFSGSGFVRRPSTMPLIANTPGAFDLSELAGWEYWDSDADMF